MRQLLISSCDISCRCLRPPCLFQGIAQSGESLPCLWAMADSLVFALNTVYISSHLFLNLPLRTFSLPFPHGTWIEENKPDMADALIPSCPGANNTVWNASNSHSFVIYCETLFWSFGYNSNNARTSISDCFFSCVNYVPNSAVDNGAECIAFSWLSPPGGSATCFII